MKNKKITISLLSIAAAGTTATLACTPIIVKNIETSRNNNIIEASITQYVNFLCNDEDVTIVGPKFIQTKVGKTFGTIKAPTAYKNQRPNAYWLYAEDYGTHHAGERVNLSDTIIKTENNELRVYPYFDNDVDITKCMGISAIEDSLVSVVYHGYQNNATKPIIEYSKDGLSWETLPTTAQTIPAGKTFYFRGNNPSGISKSQTTYTSLSIGGAVNLNGNVMTLIDNGQGTRTDIPNEYCFYRLFENCAGIKSISSKLLSAETLKPHCYESMFSSCNYLTTFPSWMLPAKDLTGAPYCYSRMFEDCRKIKTIPVGLLQAETLSEGCYYAMFNRCKGLTSVPDGTLKATTLAPSCYQGMFFKCTGLTEIGVNLLPATDLKYACYADMFAECTALTTLPGNNTEYLLPSQDLSNATACYYDMFYNCTALTTIPSNFLPATKLGPNCYMAMFYNCSALTTAPELNVSDLTNAQACYEYMFGGSGLTILPKLPATTLSEECYKGMFVYCDSLTSIADSVTETSYLPATTLAKSCYYSMFKGCKQLTTTDGNNKYVFANEEIKIHENSCKEMFFMCENLTNTPTIQIADSAAGGNYTAKQAFYHAFYRCSSLTSIGYIHINNAKGLGDNCFQEAFAECTKIQFDPDTGGTKFMDYVTDSSIETPYDHMYQLGWAPEGKTSPIQPSSGDDMYYKIGGQ